MLAYHCGECKMPLFKYEGKIICPSCKRSFKIDEKGVVTVLEDDRETDGDKKKDISEYKLGESQKMKEETTIKHEYESEYLKAKKIIRSKLFELILKMDECDDFETLSSLVDLSLKLLTLFEKIRVVYIR